VQEGPEGPGRIDTLARIDEEAPMSEPFIFIGIHSLKEGKLEDFKKYEQELVELVEANEPRLIAFHIFLNQDGT
jgi:hypothetical protein